MRLGALKPREVIRALERGGFYIHHATGSHYLLKHPGNPLCRVTVPWDNRDLKRKTLNVILKQAG